MTITLLMNGLPSLYRNWSTSSWRQQTASCLWCHVRPAALFTSLTPWHPSSTRLRLSGWGPPCMTSCTLTTQRSSESSSLLQRITTQVQRYTIHLKSVCHYKKSCCMVTTLLPKLSPFCLLFAFIGRMLDLKTGTVKKEGQPSSARMSMGARRSFICRMRCDSRYC